MGRHGLPRRALERDLRPRTETVHCHFAAPIAACVRTAVCSQPPCPAHLVSWALQPIEDVGRAPVDGSMPPAVVEPAGGTAGAGQAPVRSRTFSATCAGIASWRA
ncbi:hypothetical protein GCM10010273_52060 [Streptomyces lavendulocolor]